jgi:hypothetical protein
VVLQVVMKPQAVGLAAMLGCLCIDGQATAQVGADADAQPVGGDATLVV